MTFRDTLKIACMFTLVAVGGCDPETESAELEVAADADADADAAAERFAAIKDGQRIEGEQITLDPELEFGDALDPSAAACFTGEVEIKYSPSGVCGGCKINNVYPGQKILERYRVCLSNGTWSAYQSSGETLCDDC